MYLVPVSTYKFKRQSKLYLNLLHKYEYFFFLKTGNLNKDWLPLPTRLPSLEDYTHNPTKYESKQNSKIQIFQLISELGENLKYSLS